MSIFPRISAVATTATLATGLLLAGCAASSQSDSAAAPRAAAAPPMAGQARTFPPTPAINAAGGGAGSSGSASSGSTNSGPGIPLAVTGQQITYTASLTVQAGDTGAAAGKATAYVVAAGGYVANEQQSGKLAGSRTADISLEFKIPAARYPAVLAELRRDLGKQLDFSEQAQDVTQQVADVSSRVASTQAAIAQLRTLLGRAGSVSDLLAVQDEINSQETSLESLLAQQQALNHETSYATVSLWLTGSSAPVKPHQQAGGFIGGLRSGWHALAKATSWLLTALGAVLPFAVPLALVLLLAYLARRRQVRRQAPEATSPPAA